MKKTLVVALGIVFVAAFAMADVTQVWEPVKDAGIDGNYSPGVHHSRSADNQFRFTKMNEFGLFAFDTAAIQTFINTQVAANGLTLQDAINLGKIQVSFSVVPSGSIYDGATYIGALYSDSNWVEAPDSTTPGTGDDVDWNWTGAGSPEVGVPGLPGYIPAVNGTVQAVTPDSPFDIFPLTYDATNGGGGQWHNTFDLYNNQQFKNIPALLNSTPMTGWVQDVRNSVLLEDPVWAGYIFGVDPYDVTVAIPSVAAGLKTYGDTYDNNMSCYSKESGNVAFRPNLTVTVIGGVPPVVPHPGDTNNDGKVNVSDLSALARNYDATGLTPLGYAADGSGSWNKGDFTGDGNVNVSDLSILARNYDWVGTPAASVPEPMTLSLLAVGAAALIRRRK